MTYQQNSRIKQDERSWQDRQGGGLQERAYQRPGTQVVIHHQFARVAEALELRPGLRLLDLGCGVGHFLAWLARQMHAEYHGIDLSLNNALSAQKRNPVLQIAVGDAEFLPYKDASFDRILYNGAAHHLPDLRSAIREMYRVLAPGGVTVMYEPATTPLANAIRWLLCRSSKYESPVDLEHKDEFTRTNVETLLTETGLTGISTSYYDFLAYPLSGMYLDLPLGRSRSAMELLTRLESRLERWSALKLFFDLFAWRLLVVATKTKAKAPAQM